MTDIETAREAALLPDGLEEGVGHFVPGNVAPQSIREDNFDARTVDTALRGIYEVVNKPQTPNLLTLAKLLGAAYFVGTVQAASDTEFAHALGRVPVLLVLSLDVAGGSGRVIGRPEGGSPNVIAWSATAIYVRATATARYAFFVI